MKFIFNFKSIFKILSKFITQYHVNSSLVRVPKRLRVLTWGACGHGGISGLWLRHTDARLENVLLFYTKPLFRILISFIIQSLVNSSLARVPNQLRVLTWACPGRAGVATSHRRTSRECITLLH